MMPTGYFDSLYLSSMNIVTNQSCE